MNRKARRAGEVAKKAEPSETAKRAEVSIANFTKLMRAHVALSEIHDRHLWPIIEKMDSGAQVSLSEVETLLAQVSPFLSAMKTNAEALDRIVNDTKTIARKMETGVEVMKAYVRQERGGDPTPEA